MQLRVLLRNFVDRKMLFEQELVLSWKMTFFIFLVPVVFDWWDCFKCFRSKVRKNSCFRSNLLAIQALQETSNAKDSGLLRFFEGQFLKFQEFLLKLLVRVLQLYWSGSYTLVLKSGKYVEHLLHSRECIIICNVEQNRVCCKSNRIYLTHGYQLT